MTHTHKGEPQNEVHFKRNQNETINQAFKRFWKALAKKTDFSVAFDEQALITRSIEALNTIRIADYQAEVSSRTIGSIREEGIADELGGTETYKLKAHYTALDLLEELSENTGLSYATTFKIIDSLENLSDFAKNPPQYIHRAAALIKNIELEEMLRGLDYHLTNETFPFEFDDFIKNIDEKGYIDTPKRGVFDKMLIDSDMERKFAIGADLDDELVCFLKLPSYYKIPTPIGEYEPDFGIVMKRKQLRDGKESEFYFVIETKGTNDINDKKALKESEVYKILCAIKHFQALGVEVKYKAPIKDYMHFKQEALNNMNLPNH
jgi:type III restriction enzyme